LLLGDEPQIVRIKRISSTQAITRTEVLAIVFVVCIGLGFVPRLARLTAKTARVKCVNNLKNVALAYRVFATDFDGHFPFETPTAKGGTFEWSNNIVAQFLALTNELTTPLILNCPTRTIPQPSVRSWPSLNRSNISYYIALSARPEQTNLILTGDAGFSVDGALATNRLVQITRANRIEYPRRFHGDADAANVAMSDGSVHQFPSGGFARWQRISPISTNLILVP
jgi:hypothetical protein